MKLAAVPFVAVHTQVIFIYYSLLKRLKNIFSKKFYFFYSFNDQKGIMEECGGFYFGIFQNKIFPQQNSVSLYPEI